MPARSFEVARARTLIDRVPARRVTRAVPFRTFRITWRFLPLAVRYLILTFLASEVTTTRTLPLARVRWIAITEAAGFLAATSSAELLVVDVGNAVWVAELTEADAAGAVNVRAAARSTADRDGRCISIPSPWNDRRLVASADRRWLPWYVGREVAAAEERHR